MLLMEVEKQARKLSKSDKVRLIQDVQQWLKDENGLPDHDIYPAVDVSELDKEFPSWKYDFDEMAKVAENLNAYKATLTRPAEFDESQMIFVDV